MESAGGSPLGQPVAAWPYCRHNGLVSHSQRTANCPWNMIGNHPGKALTQSAVRFLVQLLKKGFEESDSRLCHRLRDIQVKLGWQLHQTPA
jgi:hypothetical protein